MTHRDRVDHDVVVPRPLSPRLPSSLAGQAPHQLPPDFRDGDYTTEEIRLGAAEWRRLAEVHLWGLVDSAQLRAAMRTVATLPLVDGADPELESAPATEVTFECAFDDVRPSAAVAASSTEVYVASHYRPLPGAATRAVLAPVAAAWHSALCTDLLASPVRGTRPNTHKLSIWVDFTLDTVEVSLRSGSGLVTFETSWGQADECAEREL